MDRPPEQHFLIYSGFLNDSTDHSTSYDYQEIQDSGGQYLSFDAPFPGYPPGQIFPQNPPLYTPTIFLRDPTLMPSSASIDPLAESTVRHSPDFITSDMTAQDPSQHHMYGNHPGVVPSDPDPPHLPQQLPPPGLEEMLQYFSFESSSTSNEPLVEIPARHSPSNITAQGPSQYQVYGNNPDLVPSDPVLPHSPRPLTLAHKHQEILQYSSFGSSPSNVMVQGFSQYQMYGNDPDVVPSDSAPSHSHQHLNLLVHEHREILPYSSFGPSPSNGMAQGFSQYQVYGNDPAPHHSPQYLTLAPGPQEIQQHFSFESSLTSIGPFAETPARHSPDYIPSNITTQGSSQHQIGGNSPDVVPNDPVPPHPHQHPTLAPERQKILQALCHRSSRPPISWIPDCPVSLQEKFQPPCLLWAFTFRCRFKGCGYATSRDASSSYEGYFESVWGHLKSKHAKAMPTFGSLADCGWEGCKSRGTGLNFQQTRDKMRHIVTHLPCYTLCTQCGTISARRDARGVKNSCASGNCLPGANYTERILLASQAASQPNADLTIAEYFDIVQG